MIDGDEVRVTYDEEYGGTTSFRRAWSQQRPKRLPPKDRWVPVAVWNAYADAVRQLEAADDALGAYWWSRKPIAKP